MQHLTILQISKFLDDNTNICWHTVERDVQRVIRKMRENVTPNNDGTFPLVVSIEHTCLPSGDGDLCDDNFYRIKVYNRTTDDDRAYIDQIDHVGQSVLQKALGRDLWSCAIRFDLPIHVTLTL